jgi:hypothetical protein
VAASGGGGIGSAGRGSAPIETAGAEESASASTEPPTSSSGPGDGELLTAPRADTMPERWHRKWEPVRLEREMDLDRSVGEPAPEDGRPPAVEPPTLPDPDPRLPATDPDENAG